MLKFVGVECWYVLESKSVLSFDFECVVINLSLECY